MNDQLKFTVWVSKYADTSGIYAVEVEARSNLVCQRASDRTCVDSYFTLGKNCFRSLEEAKEDARRKVARKIASAKKRLAKLEKLAKELEN